MIPLDRTILSTAFAGLAVFIIVHVLAFRTIKPEGVGNTIKYSFLMGLGANLASSIFFGIKTPNGLMALGVSLAIYAMLFFTYMNLVFGMGEAAIRIRLLRELYHRPARKADLADLYQTYNADHILRVRLDRLVKGGHLRMEEGTYIIKNRLLLRYADFLQNLKTIVQPRSKISP